MKKSLKKILIIVVAVACALSVHISVSAESIFDVGINREELSKWLSQIFNPDNGNDDPNPDNPGPNNPNSGNQDSTTTTDPTTAQNPFDPSVTGSNSVTTAAPPTYDFPTDVTTRNPGNVLTTESTTEPEEESSANMGSLSEWLSKDEMAEIIVQSPTEPFTLGNNLVEKGDGSDDFTWQKAALIAAAVLFVVLAALVAALLVQRSKNSKEDDRNSDSDDSYSDSSQSGPVPVEVMSRARIEELLGMSTPMSSAAGAMTSDESAAAIKAAALMGQLTHTYSDPLIRKYTDEPVMFSPPPSILDSDSVSGEQILKATDSMLDDITGNEKYASDISGVSVSVDDIDDILSGSASKLCPECGKPVAADDIFCHSCGAYIG